MTMALLAGFPSCRVIGAVCNTSPESMRPTGFGDPAVRFSLRGTRKWRLARCPLGAWSCAKWPKASVRQLFWSSMATFGSFALLIALALAAYNLLAGALALRLLATGQSARVSPERLADTARRAGIAGFVAISAGAFALIWSVFTNDFSITYILEHSNRALPGAYKFSALWSGQEGSLLLWAWLLGTYGFVLRLTHKPTSSCTPTRAPSSPRARCSSSSF